MFLACTSDAFRRKQGRPKTLPGRLLGGKQQLAQQRRCRPSNFSRVARPAAARETSTDSPRSARSGGQLTTPQQMQRRGARVAKPRPPLRLPPSPSPTFCPPLSPQRRLKGRQSSRRSRAGRKPQGGPTEAPRPAMAPSPAGGGSQADPERGLRDNRLLQPPDRCRQHSRVHRLGPATQPAPTRAPTRMAPPDRKPQPQERQAHRAG